MAFCANCGTKMGDGVKFCPSCGTQAGGTAPAARPEKEKAGNILKCPSCGEPVPAMAAVCPGCGHEFRNVKTSGSVTAFFDKLAEADAKALEKSSGEKPVKRTGGIILLIGLIVMTVILPELLDWELDIEKAYTLTACIGCVIIAFLSLFVKRVSFSEADNLRKGLIETFPIPNTKEDMLEFLVLASSQIVSSHGISYAARKKQAWNQIWITKCRQVYTKAEIALKGNKESLATVDGIRKKMESSMKAARIRVSVAAGIAAVALIACATVFYVQRQGAGISVPESVTIAPEHVKLSGGFADNLKVTGNGVTITTDKALSVIEMTVELEALDDLEAVWEREYQKFVKSKNWDIRNCTYKAPRFCAGVSTPQLDDYYESRSIWDITRIKPQKAQEVTVLKLTMKPNHKAAPADIRKAVASFMEQKEVKIRTWASEMLIRHTPPKNPDDFKSDYFRM